MISFPSDDGKHFKNIYCNEIKCFITVQEDSFYPAMRLLLPHLEKERVAYGIKEVSVTIHIGLRDFI